MAFFVSKQTGNWTDATTWLSGILPSLNDNVTINAGQTVTIPNGSIASAGVLNDKGILRNFGTLNMGKVNLADLYLETFKYHIRGGLTGINTDTNNNLTNSLFSYKLAYEDGTNGGYFDGNIRNQYWKSSIDGIQRAYEYSYDGASRITGATYAGKTGENYALNAVSYDDNGNIKTLSRNGLKSNNSFGLIDNLDYTYQANSNKIQEVTDKSGETASFTDATGSTDYTYSLDGSLTSDANKGITNIEYNYLKLPRRIVKNGVEILYQYDALGKKLKETIGSNFTDYNGNTIYKNGSLYQISHDEGRIINGEYEYNIKDHLGNLRVAFHDSLGIAKIVQANSYGIWGESLPTLSYLKATWKQANFRFTGKENLPETGYTDFGARFYDNIVPRFITIDGQSEKGRRWSPYCYALDSPLKYIDVDGNYPRPILKYNPATGNYNFTKSATHLLSLVSGVDKNIISSTVVQERKIGQYRPFYDSNEGGGAITIGTKDYKTITYTENFFADNKESYNGNGYGRDIKSWLSLSSHEVGHLPQIDKAGGIISYLTEFIGQYAKAGEHDSAPNEKEADKGSNNFGGFYNFVSSEYGKESIEQLFNNSKLSEETRIDRINLWWQKFEETKNKKDNEKK